MRKNQKQTEISKARISRGMKKIIADRKKQGKPWGYPKGKLKPSLYDGKEELICELWHRGYKKERIAKILGGKHSSLRDFIFARKLQPQESYLPLSELIKKTGLPSL